MSIGNACHIIVKQRRMPAEMVKRLDVRHQNEEERREEKKTREKER